MQSIYEGDVRFEHCYRLDLDLNIAPTHREACWKQWLTSYTYGQARDRIEYARRRVRAFASGDVTRPSLEASSEPDAQKVLQYVKTLHETLNRIELLGLTRQELASSKAQIYGSILRARLNAEPEFLRALVEGTPAPARVSLQDSPAGGPASRALR